MSMYHTQEEGRPSIRLTTVHTTYIIKRSHYSSLIDHHTFMVSLAVDLSPMRRMWMGLGPMNSIP